MFSKNQNKGNKASAYADKVSIIAGGMHINGDIESEGDVRIDGVVRGNVFCNAKVVVISTGRVEGDIQAINVDVHGAVSGHITARDLLSLKANCRIQGNLTTGKLQIEPNAMFNGYCTMAASQKEPAVKEEEPELVHQED